MLILLSNDDGIMAPGIQALRHALKGLAELAVIAPDRERSATGHSITVHHPIRAERVVFTGSPDCGWVVDGTPADCVKLGVCTLLNPPPDLVISGINRGANVGTDVLYSGTVSAALEASILGVASIAVSLNSFDIGVDYSYAASFTRQLCEQLMKKEISPDLLLNVNIPAVPASEMAGAAITKLGIRRYEDVFTERKDPRGKTYYWLAGDIVDDEQDEDTDVMALKNNKTSITPIHFDLTSYHQMHHLSQRLKPILK
ncbi:MAG: 5'/3'-nucleotidase SurE [Firmicutes bacterium]|nr:5'/3'-nucleotidase SurE [Bacillota bacterium]